MTLICSPAFIKPISAVSEVPARPAKSKAVTTGPNSRTAQAHGLQLHQHDVPNERLGQRSVFAQGERYIVKNRKVCKQGTKLKKHTHAPARFVQSTLLHSADVLAIKKYPAALGPDLSADQAQQGSFSAAAGTHQRRHFTARHAKTSAIQNQAFVVGEAQIVNAYKGVGGSRHGAIG